MVKNKIKDFTQQNIIIKLVVGICFILLAISIAVAVESPTTGYETSIYRSTPIFVWASLIISVLCGTTIIIHQIYTGKHEKQDIWVLGFSLIFLSYAISVSLFILRGYYMWNIGSDPAYHIGWVNQILINGHFPNNIVYPLIHTYTAELSLLLNIDLVMLHKIIPVYFSLLYVLFMYVFIRLVLPQKGQVILATTASSLLVSSGDLSFIPSSAANLYLPLVLFVLLKFLSTSEIQWKMLFIGMILLYVLFHPLPIFVIFIVFATLWIYPMIFSRATIKLRKNHNYAINKKSIVIVIILFAGAIFWFSSFPAWNNLINLKYLPQNGVSHISGLIKIINTAHGYGYNVIEQILKKEGSMLVYAILTLISFPVLYKERHVNKTVNFLLSWYGVMGLIILFIIVFFFLNLPFKPLRFMFYLITISTIFVGFFLNKIIDRTRGIDNRTFAKIGLGIVISLIVLVFINNLLILYPSPYNLGVSYHNTQTEVAGMNWLFHEKDVNVKLSGIGFSPLRFSHILLNPDERQALEIPQKIETAPYHFGYNNHSALSQSYSKDVYLSLTQKDKLLYVDVFPKIAEYRWYPNDFEKLSYDCSVDKLYSNNGFEVWYVYSSK